MRKNVVAFLITLVIFTFIGLIVWGFLVAPATMFGIILWIITVGLFAIVFYVVRENL